jgi:hypothetical protein
MLCLHFKDQLVSAVYGISIVYSESHMKYTDIFCGQSAKFLMLKQMIHVV